MNISSYEWAKLMLRTGNRVRRQNWPTALVEAGTYDADGLYTIPENYYKIWHLWQTTENNSRATGPVIKGWGGQIGADYPEFYPDLGLDGTGYSPSKEDMAATDWELYEDRLANPEPMAREPSIQAEPVYETPEHFYPWPAYLAAGAFITALMVGAILYLPWK